MMNGIIMIMGCQGKKKEKMVVNGIFSVRPGMVLNDP
jgi:hypothetical protein